MPVVMKPVHASPWWILREVQDLKDKLFYGCILNSYINENDKEVAWFLLRKR